MTFKKINFTDSATMRSLEKIALEKGLVKPERVKAPLVQMEDLSISANFTHNIMKLCAGLSRRGLGDVANEIEDNFIQYRQAQALYGTSKQTGEDVIQSAHPEGSCKLEGIDSKEAVIEDILDRHLKMVQMVNKKPTGKLSSAISIIRAVKNVFAADAAVTDKLWDTINKNKEVVSSVIDRIEEMTKDEITLPLSNVKDSISELLSNPTIDNLESVSSKLSGLRKRLMPNTIDNILMPGTLFMGISKNTAQSVNSLLNLADESILAAIKARTEINKIGAEEDIKDIMHQSDTTTPAGSTPTPTTIDNLPTDPVISMVNSSIDKIKLIRQQVQSISSLLGAQSTTQIFQWLDSKALPFAQQILTAYKSDKGNAKTYEDKVGVLDVKLDELSKKWLS